MTEKRRFIINTSSEFFGAPCAENDLNIQEFFENDDITVLAATLYDGRVQFQHRVPTEENCILFYKIPRLDNSKSNGPILGLLTLEGGMIKSIYNSVSRVFSAHSSKGNQYPPEIKSLLENLHASLGSTLGLSKTGITGIQDEILFWKQKSSNASSKTDREQAHLFSEILQRIENNLKQIDNKSLNAIEEFLDAAHTNLDEIWRQPNHYPQNRMEDLMDVISNQLNEICIEHLIADDIWNLNSHTANYLLNQVLDIIDSWKQLCDTLTRLFWPNYTQHTWIGPPHIPKKGLQLKERITEIKSIRNLFKQITSLLDDPEVKHSFMWNSPFKDINICDTSSIGQSKWNKALQQFEQILQPIDERIAMAIKSQLHNHLSNPRQVIFIFSKYDTLIQRPTVLESLTIEREQFLQSLHILLQDLRKAMSDTNMEPDTGHLSTICNECRWLKVVQYQIQEIEKVSHLISGREGFEKINQNLQELKEETDTLLRTNFEIWCDQSQSGIKSGELKLRDDQPVVQFEKKGRQLMRVTFNPKLVTFCQDVREFENLGYRVHIELRSSATHAAKFMSYARRLQQIATFHNTIGDRMIPCQRPIMLKNAMELSKLVQSEPAAWNDEESVKRYVSSLQDAVSKLSSDNNLLVGYHEQTKRTVLKLMNTDLLNQGQVWKEEMRHLRELVATLESQGYTNLEAFMIHWDHQLYKVLEYQYIYGLVDMNNRLPDIYIDLIFRQQKLQFRPPEEEISSKYFSQLKKFIERPLGFRGLSSKSADLFKIMVERNQHYFGPLYNRAQESFKKLEQLKRLWSPWVALGCVDIEELCRVHLSKWEHWDANFKSCKHFSQQIAKIQNAEENVDCFVINIMPLRSDIELISRRYWDVLSSTLKASILNDVSTVQDFLQSSLQFLQDIPVAGSDIAESGVKYGKIMSELPKISQILNEVKGKDRCLAGWCKERVSALSNILNQWEKLQPLIENHSSVLQRQLEVVRHNLSMQTISLQEEVEKFLLRWESTIAELEANEDTSLEAFKDRQQHWKLLNEKRERIFEDMTKFSLDPNEELVEIFNKVEEKISDQEKQWSLYEDYLNEFDKVSSEEWTIYRKRPYVFTEFLTKWENAVRSSTDLPSARIRQAIERYQIMLPTLQKLQSDALTERHWTKIFQLLGKELKPSHTILLKDVTENSSKLQKVESDLQNLIRQASSEQIVRQALNELDQWAVTANLKLTNHKDSSGNEIVLIKDYQEILNKIGDHQSLLQSAKNAAAFETFTDQAEIWENRLNVLDTILTSLNHSQRKWLYLEPVFSTGTIKNEEALFKRVDRDFRYIMQAIRNDPRVVSVSKINNVSAIINSLETQLSKCQNSLISYMTEKRNSFPRFYFLSDDDLLEILGQASRPEIIQKHVKKLFPGISSLGLENGGDMNFIKAIHSVEGDVLTLSGSIQMKGPIENWLNQLWEVIQSTLKDQMRNCLQNKTITEEVARKYPIQVISTTRSIQFTQDAEKAIKSMNLKSFLKKLQDEISEITKIKIKNYENNLIQIKLKALLVDLVHYVSIVELLLEKNVTSIDDWHWLQQIKFYSSSSSSDFVIKIKVVFAEFDYSYEFLGNPNKLINTNLTHKCYLTLTQSMQLGLGGNPFGPAGTGKTECVKALGAMLGRLVLVFNCDENVDTEAMALILIGLARCGAWGCFDEFNRLQEATLSAISMLIQPIQSALKDKNESVIIMEKKIALNHHCGIFVTLNPAGEEYGGRQQLPENIKALFRPIAMEQPEPSEISKVMLFVEGYRNAKEIGNRIVELFDLCKNCLSSEKHYDWGLRELKTILIACGNELCRRNSISEEDEMEIAVQCLRSNILSKLNVSDSLKFDMLLKTTFPEVIVNQKSETDLLTAISNTLSSLEICENKRQIDKAIQLYEQLTKRMGVVIVGPPFSGKSTIISLLQNALKSMGKPIKSYTLSPKSMDREQLLGKLDPDTRQWCDGVLTSCAVTVNQEPSHVTSWIICDGDIDPEWIEALNSVLDDNRMLTLPSGWRIQFGNNVNFLFETHDLSHASPATISRMGIIKLSEEDLPTETIIESFIRKSEFNDLLRSYSTEFLTPTVELVMNLGNPLNIPKSSLIRAGLQNTENISDKEEFCIATIKNLLGFVYPSEHNTLVNKICEDTNIYISDPLKADLAFYNKARNQIEIHFTDSSMTTMDDQSLIETALMKSYMDLIRNFLKDSNSSPFVLIGPSGCGKTKLLQRAISEFSGYKLVMINCSTQLSAKYILHVLKQNSITVSGARGREYRPQQTKIVLFLKNIDLCNIDSWGTSDVIEMILQLIKKRGFYSNSSEWIGVSGLQIGASMSAFNRNKLSPRYLSINNVIHMKYPAEEDMKLIVRNHMEPILSQYKKTIKIDRIVDVLIDCFQEIQDKFGPNQRNHYHFTPKKIIDLISALENYSKGNFDGAFVTEINSRFKSLLVDSGDVEEYEMILKGTIGRLIQFEEEESYFIPKSAHHESKFYPVSLQEWTEIVRKNIAICNADNFLIGKTITNELLSAVAFVSRTIACKGTHLVLVEQKGCGGIEALYIAATLLSAKIYLPQGDKNYNLTDFYNDLKMAMQSAAMDNLTTIFLIDHCWLTNLNEIIKPIEAVLEESEILELFGDDLESIAGPLKSDAQNEGFQESLSSYFLHRVKQNLHLVLDLDANSNDLNDLFSAHPSLYKNTQIVWLQQLSKETLSLLPKEIINSITNNVESVPVPIHFAKSISITMNYMPEKYYQLISTYVNVFISLEKKTKERLEKLKMGVEKLSHSKRVVAQLESDAAKQEEALAQKRKLASEALEMISATMRSANDQKSDLLDLKKKTQENSEILKERKKAIEEELSEVEPILKEASAAVGQIKSEALSEIRSLRAPPETIRDILEGVLRLMGIRDTSWNSMKSFLAKRGVKEDIRSLDPSRINRENCEAVERLLESKSESFEMKNAKRASVAAAPLAAWVIASVRYAKVIQSIKPLEREQNELQRHLNTAENEMKSLMSGLDDVDARVKELSEQLNVYTQEAAVLELKLKEARDMLSSAQILVGKLSSEFKNWNKQLEEYNETYKTMDVKSFLIAFSLNYYANMLYEERRQALDELTEILDVESFDIIRNLITEQDQVMWESMGISRDAQTIENASIIIKMLGLPFESSPVPFIIDPSESILKWLQDYLRYIKKNFDLVSQNANKFSYTLELAVRFGKILLVTDAQNIRPPLMQILLQRIYTKFNKNLIQIGSKFVEIHEHFKLILITKLNQSDIDFQPALIKIPFTITKIGLTDQLISNIIQSRNPQLEQKRTELLKREWDLLQQRITLEDKLLEELTASQGDILKNEKLLRTLNEIKESASEIEESLKESSEIKKNLLEEYAQYRPMCTKISEFYMGLTTLYDISMPVFTRLFLNSIEYNENNEKVYSQLIKTIYQYICRSTPKDSRLTLGLFICKNAFPDKVPNFEWELFVTNFMMNNEEQNSIELPSWIRREQSQKILALFSQIPEFKNSLQLENEDIWRRFVSENTSEVPVVVNDFQKILIYQIFRPDLMLNSLNQFVTKVIDIKFGSETQPSIEQLATESTKFNPILIITEPGNDPSMEIKSCAFKKIGTNKFVEISVGKGMEKETIGKIKQATIDGNWICLKNVHLVPKLLVELDYELDAIKDNTVDDFRLWIVCDTEKHFPDSFIYKCIKILFESPNGLRNKIYRLMSQYLPATSESGRDSVKIKLHVLQFILYSILQERRKYIPQGWSKWYEFGDPDLRVLLEILRWLTEVSSSKKIDWLTFQGLSLNLAYGGYIVNNMDSGILMNILREFMNDKVLSDRFSPLSLNVNIPTTSNIQEYYSVLQKLSDADKPETFGLSSKSNLSRDITLCKETIKTLRSAYFKQNEQSSVEKRIRPILVLWKKLVANLTINNIAKEIVQKDTKNPWESFVISEVLLANSLFKEIHSTLVQIHSIIRDEKSDATTKDKILFKCLGENQVPIAWKRLWNGPKVATEYIKSVAGRISLVEKRFKNELHVDFVEFIDLSTVFKPDAFFSALKMYTAQKIQKSSSNLQLISDERNIDTSLTVKIASLMVDGAFFSGNKVTIFNKNDDNVQSPEYFIAFVAKEKASQFKFTDKIYLPVYSNSSREKLVCSLLVSTNETSEDLILSGAALLIPNTTE